MGESRSAGVNSLPAIFPEKSQRANTLNSIQSTVISYADLGQSLNPYTSLSGNRNYVSVNPVLNTVALFRRGSEVEKPLADQPQNELYYDLNTKGAAPGQWQIARGKLYDNDIITDDSINFGPRFPQGVLWNPPGNTDTAQAIAFSISSVLDGSNESFGGIGKGWQKLAAGSPTYQTRWTSSIADPISPVYHFLLASMDVTSTGAIFTIEPELDLTKPTGFEFINNIMIYKYVYNSNTQSFDSTVTALPFINTNQDPATAPYDYQIAFGPEGQVGYVVLRAYNPDLSLANGSTLFIASTSNGGNSWSDFTVYNINKMPDEIPNFYPDRDAFRNEMAGNYITYSSDSTYYKTDTGSAVNAYPVQYSLFDMDLTVDKYNYAHIFSLIGVIGVGDTIPYDAASYYPGYGSYNVNFTVEPGTNNIGAKVLGKVSEIYGCWGDCEKDRESFRETTRPQVSRSADGSIISLVWYETDQVMHPQTDRTNGNSNPDLFLRTIRVDGPGDYYYSSQNRNITKGSDYDGQATLGSVAPTMLQTPTGYTLASTIARLSAYNPPSGSGSNVVGGVGQWPVSHHFVNGINIPSISATDSFPVRYRSRSVFVGNNDLIGTSFNKRTKISLYPNPSKGSLSAHLDLDKAGIGQFNIINALGQSVQNSSLMLNKGGVNIPFNVKNLKQGVYFMQVKVGDQKGSQRFVIE